MISLPFGITKSLAVVGTLAVSAGLVIAMNQVTSASPASSPTPEITYSETASHQVQGAQHGKNKNQGQGGQHGKNSQNQGNGQGGQHGKNNNQDQNHSGSENEVIEMNPDNTQLNAEVEELLVFLIQEEKVAYDLYSTIGDETGLRQMQNISSSESRHMDAVRNLLAAYSLDDPTTGLAVGEFTDASLQSLYDELLALGIDTAGAVEVGIAVEEKDIADIIEMLEMDLPADVVAVLENLLKGSYNHLAAFNR